MNDKNFQTMTRQKLHNYILTHRKNVEAFHAYVDKLNEEGDWIEMFPVESIEELENNPELIQHFRKKSES